jgi:hypothetical protein
VPERSGQPNFITEKLGNVPVGNVPVNIPIRGIAGPGGHGHAFPRNHGYT